MSEWKKVDSDECPNCGDEAEILTDCKQPDLFCDGDDVRCANKCGMVGNFICDGEGYGWIGWDEDGFVVSPQEQSK